MGSELDTRAYVVKPSFDTFNQYAHTIEGQMSPRAQAVSSFRIPPAKRSAAQVILIVLLWWLE